MVSFLLSMLFALCVCRCGRWSQVAPVLIFLPCSPSPFGPVDSLWGGVVVVWGHPGTSPSFIGGMGHARWITDAATVKRASHTAAKQSISQPYRKCLQRVI